MRFRLSCGCARIGVLASQQSNESLCGDVAAKAAVVHSNSQHVLGAAGDDALFSEPSITASPFGFAMTILLVRVWNQFCPHWPYDL